MAAYIEWESDSPCCSHTYPGQGHKSSGRCSSWELEFRDCEAIKLRVRAAVDCREKDQGNVRVEIVVGNACGGKPSSHGSKAIVLQSQEPQEQTPVDDPHAEVEIKPQLKPGAVWLRKKTQNLPTSCTSFRLNPHNQLSRLCVYGIYKRSLRAPTKENTLALIAVDTRGKNTHQE